MHDHPSTFPAALIPAILCFVVLSSVTLISGSGPQAARPLSTGVTGHGIGVGAETTILGGLGHGPPNLDGWAVTPRATPNLAQFAPLWPVPIAGSSDGVGITTAKSKIVTLVSLTYPVTFTESGLPSGAGGNTSWSISVDNHTLGSTTNKIEFLLTNGTHFYHVNTVPGYDTTPQSPPTVFFNVTGAPVNISLKFTLEKYTISFVETGLPSGTPWCVTLTPGSTSCLNAKTIRVLEPNGTYAYSASLSGYSTQSGLVKVNGSNPATVDVTFTPISHSSSGLPTIDYVIIGVLAGVCALAVAAYLLRRRRVPPETSEVPPPEPDSSVPPAPP